MHALVIWLLMFRATSQLQFFLPAHQAFLVQCREQNGPVSHSPSEGHLGLRCTDSRLRVAKRDSPCHCSRCSINLQNLTFRVGSVSWKTSPKSSYSSYCSPALRLSRARSDGEPGGEGRHQFGASLAISSQLCQDNHSAAGRAKVGISSFFT